MNSLYCKFKNLIHNIEVSFTLTILILLMKTVDK